MLKFQQAFQERLERQPVKFLVDEFEPLWDDARHKLAQFVGADVQDLVFVSQRDGWRKHCLAFTRIQTRRLNCLPQITPITPAVARWIMSPPAPEARVIVCENSFSARIVANGMDAVLAKVTRRTRLALLDHVTSSTGLVLPLEKIDV